MAPKSNHFCIYVDYTLDGRPFYVGQGSQSRARKLKRNARHSAIAKLHGQVREIELITSVKQIALDMEIELIKALKTRHGVPGHWGANFTSGGEGVNELNDEARLKMSEARKKRAPISELTRQRMSEAQQKRKGEKRLAETRLRLSQAAQRRKLSDDGRKKLSDALKGRRHSDETRSKISSALKGRTFSDESRKKMSEGRIRANIVRRGAGEEPDASPTGEGG